MEGFRCAGGFTAEGLARAQVRSGRALILIFDLLGFLNALRRPAVKS